MMLMATNISNTKIIQDIPAIPGMIIPPETHGEKIAKVTHGTLITTVKTVVVHLALEAQTHTHGIMTLMEISLKPTMMDHPGKKLQMVGNIPVLMDQPNLAHIERVNTYIDL